MYLLPNTNFFIVWVYAGKKNFLFGKNFSGLNQVDHPNGPLKTTLHSHRFVTEKPLS